MCRCKILAHIITADAVFTAGATGSFSRNSLALKQLITYTCAIVYNEINFNQVGSLVGKKLSYPVNSMFVHA